MGDTTRDQSQNDWDVIVIGSGIGGMAASAALSRTGHKVLLLEQLRMKTPIDGLYLAGQDVCSPGIIGALCGGVLCAANVDSKVFTYLRN